MKRRDTSSRAALDDVPGALRRLSVDYSSAVITTAVLDQGLGRFSNLYTVVEFQGGPVDGTLPRSEPLTPKPLSLPGGSGRFTAFKTKLGGPEALRMLQSWDPETGLLTYPFSQDQQRELHCPGKWVGVETIPLGEPVSRAIRSLLPHYDSLLTMVRLQRLEAVELAPQGRHGAIERIRKFVGADLRNYPEYFGSLVALFPEERLRVRTVVSAPRGVVGVEIEGDGRGEGRFTAAVTGIRGARTVASRAVPAEMGHTIVSLECPCDSFVVRVFDERGRLRFEEHAHPVRSFSSSFLAKTGATQVESKGAGRGGLVVESGFTTVSGVSDETEVELVERAAARQRAQAKLEASSSLLVFSGAPEGREVALSFVREKLASAQRRVLLVDRFVGGDVLLDCLPGRIFGGVDFRIVTGAGSDKELKKLRKSLRAVVSKLALPVPEGMGMRIEARKASGLHDRFLVCDDEVWFVGHSFNAVGRHVGAILRIESVALIEKILDELWTRGQPLED